MQAISIVHPSRQLAIALGASLTLVVAVVLAATLLVVGPWHVTASTPSDAATKQAWLQYRAGERGDMTLEEQAWLQYRAGERADLGKP